MELVEAQLARFGNLQNTIHNASQHSNGDPILKWSNVLQGIKVRLAQQLTMMSSSTGGTLDSQIRASLTGHATADVLVAARCMLKHEVKKLASQRVDWNEQFQTLLDLAEDTPEAKLFKYSSLSHVAKDFTYAAELCARVIINELNVPVPLKTIKPLQSQHGTAGGTKFQSCSILFKLATDHHNLYGGIRPAQKACGHELKSMAAYFDCRIPGLHVPLSCLIDYRGHRMLALSILPIDRQTLRYGSDDGGRTVHDDQPLLAKKLREAAALLNLAPHLAGVYEQKFLYSACDVEGHQGRDGRNYIVDFARGFPPETPRVPLPNTPQAQRYRGSHLYRLLRPELVKKAPSGPLSPDAFSGFGGGIQKYNRDVQLATNYLISQVIPQFAREMDQSPLLSHPPELLERLSQLLHRAGINVRYMGAVRHRSSNGRFRSILVLEMMARTMKRRIWEGFRQVQLLQALPSEEPYRRFAVETFNRMLAPEDPEFWGDLKRDIVDYFGNPALESWEQRAEYDLRANCDSGMGILARRVAALTGIRISDDALVELDQAAAFQFVDADIERVDTRIKSMNVVEISSAVALSMQAASSTERDRLFKLCYRKFEAAANASPSNITTSRYWAAALLAHAQGLAHTNASRACALLAEADLRMQDCSNVKHKASLRVHCEIVSLLAQLTVDVPHGAGLFVRALGLASAVEDRELMLEVVAMCRRCASLLPSPASATLMLNRMRIALIPHLELEARFKNASNAMSVDLLDLAGPLDIHLVESLHAQFLKDDDNASLVKLCKGSLGKYAALAKQEQVLDLPLRLIAMVDQVLARIPNDETALEIRGELGLLMTCNAVLQVGPVEDKVSEGIACLKKCNSRERASRAAAYAERMLILFFDTTVFVENSYRVRSHCALCELNPVRMHNNLVWEASSSQWIPMASMMERLEAKLAVICRIACRALELSCAFEPSSGTLVAHLTLPMTASLFRCGEPSVALQAGIADSISALSFKSAFGLDEASARLVAKVCGSKVCCIACDDGADSASLLTAAAPYLVRLERMDLSRCMVSAVPLQLLLQQNGETLIWIALAARSALTIPVASKGLPVLQEVMLYAKVVPDTLYELLAYCPRLRTVLCVRGEKRIRWDRSPAAKGELAAQWARTLMEKNATTSSLGRSFCKAFYRCYLSRDPRGLDLLVASEPQLFLLQKLGKPLLHSAIRGYVLKGEFDQLFNVLCTVDRLESYDPSSTLGWLIDSLRQELMGNSFPHFRRYLTFVREHRYPSVLASLPVSTLRKIIDHYLTGSDEQRLFIVNLGSSLESSLQNGMANSSVVTVAVLIRSAQLQSGTEATTRLLENAFEALATEGGPVQAHQLMLTHLCMPSLVEGLPWPSLASFFVVNVPCLLDGSLLTKFINLLPEGPRLRRFGVRYSAKVTEEVSAVTDDTLSLLARRCPHLSCVQIDYSSSVTNVGVCNLVASCHSLNTLWIRSPHVDGDSVEAIITHLADTMRDLTLQCSLRDLVLSKLGSQLSCLVSIQLYACPFITMHGLEKLCANTRSLKRVCVQDCRQITLDYVQVRKLEKQIGGELLLKTDVEK